MTGVRNVAGRELEITADQLAETRKLPSADKAVQQTARLAADEFALAERQVHQEIPVHAMLRNRGIPAIVEQTVARRIVGGHQARQINVRAVSVSSRQPSPATRMALLIT